MTSRAAQGYLLVAGSFLIIGVVGCSSSGPPAPESALLVIRFATAGLVLGVVFARRAASCRGACPGVWPRLLLMGLVDAVLLLSLLR